MEPHQDDAGHEPLPTQLRVDPAVVQSAGIRTQPVKRAALATTVALPGEIVSEPDKTARLSTATGGRLEQVTFNEGSVVKKGDVMALIRVPDVGRLRGAFAATTARAKASRANAERLRALREQNLSAAQAVTDAEAEARALDAEAKAVADQLNAIGVNAETGGGYLVTLRAPISGVVVFREAVVGQPVNTDQVLATIVDLSEVWFIGRVFEKDLSRLKLGAPAEVAFNAFPDEHFLGVIDYVGQQIDPVARTLTARVRLKNETQRLRIGLFGTAHVEVEDGAPELEQLVVPRSAVTDVAGKRVVFVRAKDGDFVLHEVALGASALSLVQVLSGLSEGEEVVTEGVFTLKSLLLKSTLAHDEGPN